MANGRRFQNSFIAISQLEIINFNEIWYVDADCASNVGYLTKYENFANSKWRTAAILKIVFWLYLND